MIYKLTLETEHPEYLLNFLQAYGYLRTGYPIDTSDIQDDGFMRNCSGKIRNTGNF